MYNDSKRFIMKKRPNILIITTDQQRYDTLGIDNPVIKTPTLDRLASEGLRFNQAYSPNPVCVPARYNLLTGLSSKHHGFDDNDFAHVRHLPFDVPTFPQLLSDVGYETIAIGKIHFQPNRDARGIHHYLMMDEIPHYREEDDYALYLKQSHPEISSIHGVRDPLYMMPQTSMVELEHHGSVWAADRSIETIKRIGGKRPFMMWTGFVHPHPPLDVPKEFSDLYKDAPIKPCVKALSEGSWLAEENKNIVQYPDEAVLKRFKELYYSAITLVDTQIKRILDALEETGELDNTLILFCSDHGEMLGDLGTFQKFLPHDASARIPMILRYPPKVKAGTQSEALVSLSDVLPTILDLVDIPYPAPHALIGKSLFDLSDRSSTILEHGKQERRWLSLVTVNYKYTYYYGGAREELVDRINDPFEQFNLMDKPDPKHRALADGFKAKLIEWESKHGLSDHLKDGTFMFYETPSPMAFAGTGPIIFPFVITDPLERSKIASLASQIIDSVKAEPTIDLSRHDFSYMIKTGQLTLDEVENIIAADKKNKGR
jgi:arylsulfatase